MKNELANKTALVRDNGFFLPLARHLAKSFGRVIYCPTWEKGFPVINEAIIGDGFPELDWCENLWLEKKNVDLFVFPDVGYLGEQRELRSQGERVWGSGEGMKLERSRKFFLKKLEELGLDVAPHKVVTGLSALRRYLQDKEDIFIKISKYRGSFETKHFRNWQLDSGKLDLWAMRFGGSQELIDFLCFDKIETTLEIGCDTFCVDGRWPLTMLHGIEKKDQAYFAAVTPKDEMPDELTHIMDRFSPYLNEVQYRSQWSMEVRLSDQGAYFIDATCRGGLPSTGSQMDLLSNFAEILWHGAAGEPVEPEYQAKYSAECMVKVHGEPDAWETLTIPEELVPHLKVYDCCLIDGQPHFPADRQPIEELGWLVVTGDTPTSVAKEMNRLADLLPDGADAAVEGLADIIREIEDEQSSGIKFGNHKMPDPAIVLET